MDVAGNGVASLLDRELVVAAVQARESPWWLWVVIGDGEALVFIDAIFFLDSLYPSSHCREGRPGLFHWHVVDEGRQMWGRQWVDVLPQMGVEGVLCMGVRGVSYCTFEFNCNCGPWFISLQLLLGSKNDHGVLKRISRRNQSLWKTPRQQHHADQRHNMFHLEVL